MIPGLVPVWDAPANVAALSTTRRGGTSLAPYDDGSGSGALGLNLGVHVGVSRCNNVDHDDPAPVAKVLRALRGERLARLRPVLVSGADQFDCRREPRVAVVG